MRLKSKKVQFSGIYYYFKANNCEIFLSVVEWRKEFQKIYWFFSLWIKLVLRKKKLVVDCYLLPYFDIFSSLLFVSKVSFPHHHLNSPLKIYVLLLYYATFLQVYKFQGYKWQILPTGCTTFWKVTIALTLRIIVLVQSTIWCSVAGNWSLKSALYLIRLLQNYMLW